MVLRNIAGNLNPTAFRQGARDELELQARQRAEQDRLDKLKFRELTGGPPKLPEVAALNQGSTGLKLDGFGGQYKEIEPDEDKGKIDTTPKVKVKPIPGTTIDPDKDGVLQTDGSLDESANVDLNAKDLTYPLTDPDKIALPPKGMGKGNEQVRREEVLRRRDIDRQIRDLNLTGKIIGSKATMDMSAFYKSDEFKNFIYQHPQFIDEIKKDPEGFMTRFTEERGARTTKQQVIPESKTRTDKLISGRNKAMDNDILISKKSNKVVKLANELGIDPIAALSIFGIESDFGRNAGKSSAGAEGGMQVMPEQWKRLRLWFGNPDNRAQIESAYTTADGQVNKARVDAVIQRIIEASKPGYFPKDPLVAGMAQLIYNKAIGLPKNLWGAGYQGNANLVLKAGQPLAVDDGNISNSDYNRAYVDIYNTILNKHGAALLNKHGNLAGIDLANIPGSGIGKPIASGPAQVLKDGSLTQVGITTDDADAGVTTNIADANAGLNTDTSNIANANKSTITADNRGKEITADGSFVVVDQKTGVDTGGTPPEEKVPTSTKEPEPPAFYLEDESRIGFELRNFLEERELIINNTNKNIQVLTQRADYFRRLARITRDETEFNNLMKQSTDLMAKANTMRDSGALEAKKAENKIMLLQGMQALSDLQKGSVNRAAMVWSEFSGLDIRIDPRSDGKYDVTVRGKPYKTMDYKQLSDTLRLAFDQGYRASQSKLASDMNLETFKSQLKIQEQAAKDRGQSYIERVKTAGKIAEQKYKNDTTVEFKTSDGIPYIVRGNRVFMIDYVEKVDQNGDKYEELQEIEVQQPLQFAQNAYK